MNVKEAISLIKEDPKKRVKASKWEKGHYLFIGGGSLNIIGLSRPNREEEPWPGASIQDILDTWEIVE